MNIDHLTLAELKDLRCRVDTLIRNRDDGGDRFSYAAYLRAVRKSGGRPLSRDGYAIRKAELKDKIHAALLRYPGEAVTVGAVMDVTGAPLPLGVHLLRQLVNEGRATCADLTGATYKAGHVPYPTVRKVGGKPVSETVLRVMGWREYDIARYPVYE